MMTRDSILKEAEAVVLRGLAQGYASGAKATRVPGKPGHWYYEHIEGPWYLRDEFYVDSHSKKSVGTTTLERQDDDGRFWLIWKMIYGGFCKEEATPCLRAALLDNYRARRFEAGRGTNLFQMDAYRYIIDIASGSSFNRLYATERVVRINKEASDPREQADTTPMGGHDIWGMALI